jgi:hypothetical protein
MLKHKHLLKYCVQLLLNEHNNLTNVYDLTFYVHYYNISCVDWKIVNVINSIYVRNLGIRKTLHEVLYWYFSEIKTNLITD